MQIVFEIIFWISVALVFHSYVLFPLILNIASSLKKVDNNNNTLPDNLPEVSILISAYNEEELIEDKVNSILKSDYPLDKIEILIGSDCSTDQTNEILKKLESRHKPLIHFYPFTTRQGKPNVINQLAPDAKGSILILSDANVIFDTSTIRQLIIPFNNPQIGLIDSQMINKGARPEGISVQEKAYISREVAIKYHESILWGAMMGPFGGCFAMRKELFENVPSNFLVDDFFLNMIVLEKGFKAINNPKALVFEDVSNDLKIEYKRKIRIASGNFQNLFRFKKLLLPPWSGVSFSFFAHKVIRWFGPLFFIIALVSLIILGFTSKLYFVLLLLYLLLLIIPLFDLFLRKMSIHISFFRFITHFCAMNLAMLVGLLKYGKGIKSNVWQPTKRNQ
ncbi:MAG: glycosyltransferase [Bacteroidales bacterium]|nr:glycosyltransferase [Bacteroidales bacterium]